MRTFHTWTNLYSDATGNWLLVTGPTSESAPLELGGLELQGPLEYCVWQLYDWLKSAMPTVLRAPTGRRTSPVQQIIADGAGVAQTTVSLWLSRKVEPDLGRLDPVNSRWLIRMFRCAAVWQETDLLSF